METKEKSNSHMLPRRTTIKNYSIYKVYSGLGYFRNVWRQSRASSGKPSTWAGLCILESVWQMNLSSLWRLS